MLAIQDFVRAYDVKELFLKGGPVMWPLLACSVLATAIILERVLVYSRMGRVPRALATSLAAALARGARGEARSAAERSGHPMAGVFKLQVDLADRSKEERVALVQREGGLVLERLEARLSPLLLVAQVAPLLGLLGTVTGLVSSFRSMEQVSGPVQPSDLAAGIWAALLTTVFGLCVGIPASAAWHLLQDRADAFARHMGFAATEIEDGLARGRLAARQGSSRLQPDSVPSDRAQATAAH
ncbi:MAG: MotA/TolQ/ExbB proton channel family protein [Planctomycetota bacterium]